MEEPAERLIGTGRVAPVVAAAFRLLLDGEGPVEAAALAAATGLEAGECERLLGEAGPRVRRLSDGCVHGAIGLDVLPTAHCLRLDGRRARYTWCAWDVLGIVGALEAGGEALSTSPWTGAPVRLRFDGGRVTDEGGAVLFLATRAAGVSPPDWCPFVNLFHAPDDARAWAALFGVSGRALAPSEGLALGTPRWREALEA